MAKDYIFGFNPTKVPESFERPDHIPEFIHGPRPNIVPSQDNKVISYYEEIIRLKRAMDALQSELEDIIRSQIPDYDISNANNVLSVNDDGTKMEWKPATSASGVSASVEQTETGATITVTDASGTTTATVENGENGQAGPGVPAGGTAGQVLTKKSGTDYDTEWKDPTGSGGVTGQQLVKWVEEEEDKVTNVYPFHRYERYNINAQSVTGSALEPVKGTMNGIDYNYTITFSDNVTLDIPETFQYKSDSVSLIKGLSYRASHNAAIRATLTIPSPSNDIIVTAEDQTSVTVRNALDIKCTIENGSVVYIEGLIDIGTDSLISIDKTPLFHFSSDFVSKYEVLKTVQG